MELEVEGTGLDSDGRTFSSTHEMWQEETGGEDKKEEWYKKGVGYWENVEASVDGVLGGYGHVNHKDVQSSSAFLASLLSKMRGEVANLVALDCGAGVGRVTEHLLLNHFQEVDLVEPVSHFLESASEKLKDQKHSKSEAHRAVNFYCIPLQEFTPEPGRYDVIWIQWCIGHLTDADLVAFFSRAKVLYLFWAMLIVYFKFLRAGLKPGGFFVLKENVARNGFVLDKEDHSVTRSDAYFRKLFNQAGLDLIQTKAQKGFPEELFPVKMYALTPEAPAIVQDVLQNKRPKRQINKPSIIR